MSEQKPSVGRVVHYVSYGTPPRADSSQAFQSQCRAAIITGVNDDGSVSLAVLNPTGMFFHEQTMGDFTENQGGTWHWPLTCES